MKIRQCITPKSMPSINEDAIYDHTAGSSITKLNFSRNQFESIS